MDPDVMGLSLSMQTEQVPQQYEAIFRTIEVMAYVTRSDPRRRRKVSKWNIGFASLSIQETMNSIDVFDVNVNNIICTFADSSVCIQYKFNNSGPYMVTIKDAGEFLYEIPYNTNACNLIMTFKVSSSNSPI